MRKGSPWSLRASLLKELLPLLHSCLFWDSRWSRESLKPNSSLAFPVSHYTEAYNTWQPLWVAESVDFFFPAAEVSFHLIMKSNLSELNWGVFSTGPGNSSLITVQGDVSELSGMQEKPERQSDCHEKQALLDREAMLLVSQILWWWSFDNGDSQTHMKHQVKSILVSLAEVCVHVSVHAQTLLRISLGL